ncbi:MAG: 3'-5' exonuclease [Spirosomataceae bacterium]|mgnify:CR=1 FL=1
MPFLVIDLEMTGTEPGWHEIIQLGAVLYDDNWEEKGRYLTNIYPENEESFSQSAQQVHGLTLDELDDAPMIYDVLPAFENWVMEQLGFRNVNLLDKSPYLRTTIVCGQSVINDINFLKFAYREEKMKYPFSNVLLDLHTLSYFVFDVLKQNGRKTPRSLSLKAIAEHFGFEREGDTHNALEDAVLTGMCIKEVMKLGKRLKLTE